MDRYAADRAGDNIKNVGTKVGEAFQHGAEKVKDVGQHRVDKMKNRSNVDTTNRGTYDTQALPPKEA